MEMVVEKTGVDAIWAPDSLALVRHHIWRSIRRK